jgi:hypothetical protein
MSTVYEKSRQSPETYRAEAAASRKEAFESFERSDTDGFLSQWASGVTASLADRKAELAEANWQAPFAALFDLAGNRVDAKLIDGKFGKCWAIIGAGGRFTGVFVAHYNPPELWRCGPGEQFYETFTKEFARHQKRIAKKGYQIGVELAPANARLASNGRGLSGNVWVETYRTDGK